MELQCKEETQSGGCGDKQAHLQCIHSTTTPERFLCVPCACEEGSQQTEPLPYEKGNTQQNFKLKTCAIIHGVKFYSGKHRAK